jgi:hypothetical protein
MDGKLVKVTIVESVIGVLGFSEDNKLAEKVFFPKDPKKTAERLQKIEEGKLIDEISSLVDKLQAKGYTHFVFENQKMARSAGEKLNIEVSAETSSEAGKLLRENLEKFALDLKIVVGTTSRACPQCFDRTGQDEGEDDC